MAKGWTEERRKKQAEMIRQWKPWEKSTGPRTAGGKEESRMNAFKHGDYSQAGKETLKEAKAALRCNNEFLEHFRRWAEAQNRTDYWKYLLNQRLERE
jgi:hypothetical protein